MLPGQVSNGETPSSCYKLGDILDQGLNRLSEIYGSDSYVNYTKEIFHCFGDPSMLFPTSVPTSYRTGLNGIQIVRSNSDITIFNMPGNQVLTFYNRFNGQVHSWLSASGTKVFSTNHPNYVDVCIYNHNRIPYINVGSSGNTTMNNPQDSFSEENLDLIPSINQVSFASDGVTIRCDIPIHTSTIQLCLYNSQGNIEKMVYLNPGENSHSFINITKGFHIVALIVDGTTVDTKEIKK